MSMIKWTPRRSLMTLPSDLDQFFGNFGIDYNTDTVWNPAVDIAENEKEYEVKAELPGMKKDEIKISFENDVLTLSGERKNEKEENDKNFHRIERSYGKFERCFHLPKNVKVSDINAGYKNGILTVNIPKSEEEKPKEIAIS